ncbi:sulfotransferase family protein [Limobrevibacterium gyesilva]|uniref:Sulfotransferase family protein n=1 Tax=Limobrevibacterium gyesilva TaxID=2991712 RepID=A0AA42CG49_9PROT|nr:hypothetical protein [Limobrevibacterium gyesilva]MCW3475651.1 hypothetical protein [Limobrevibacterium gyesilva]
MTAGTGPAARVAILVIGVSRSGSSALTRVLNLLGVALPEELLGPGRGNERGHFEPLRLLQLNDEILRSHGATWWDPIAIPPAWFDGPQAAEFAERVAERIAQDYGDAKLLVIKDPRLCRLMPIYRRALQQLGIAPRGVLPLRHPAEVVGSLGHRDGTDPRTSELLYVRDLLGAEAFSRDFPRVWTSFEGLLADWRGTVARIAAGLQLTWPNPPESVAAAIEGHLAPALRTFDVRRHAGQPAGVVATAGALSLALWQAAQGAIDGGEAELRSVFDPLGLVVGEIDRLSVPHLDAARVRLAEIVAERDQLRASVADLRALGPDRASE